MNASAGGPSTCKENEQKTGLKGIWKRSLRLGFWKFTKCLRALNHVLALTEGQFQGRGTNKIKQGDGVCHLTFAILCYHHNAYMNGVAMVTGMEVGVWAQTPQDPTHQVGSRYCYCQVSNLPATETSAVLAICHHTSRTASSHLVEFGCSRLLMPLPQLGQVWNVLSAPEPIGWAWNLLQISFSLCPILFSSSLRDDAVQ